jgi:hypothetical protein
MIKLVLCALGLTAITVIIHGAGAMAFSRRVAGRWTGRKDRPGRFAAELLMAQLVGALLLLHLAEAIVWALFYVAELESAGIAFRLAGAHATVRDILRAEGLEERAGYFGRRITAVDVVDEFEGIAPPTGSSAGGATF